MTNEQKLAALADGELDPRDRARALAELAQNPQAGRQVAQHLQLKHAVGQAMDGPSMKCPAELSAKLRSLAQTEPTHADTAATPAPALPVSSVRDARQTPYQGPAVLARIGRWMPAAVAAVLLIAATVMFMQAGGGAQTGDDLASLLSVSQVERFDKRHIDCAARPEILHQHDNFGDTADFEQLPIKLGSYFKTSTDGMKLNLAGVGYDYQLTGVCGLPGDGAVHIIYRHHDQPGRAISLWVLPDDGRHQAIKPDRLYVEAGNTLDHPVIVWRQGGLLYYLVGDSLQDAHAAVDALRSRA